MEERLKPWYAFKGNTTGMICEKPPSNMSKIEISDKGGKFYNTHTIG